MKINNFDKFNLDFKPKEFYFIQIIPRNKDGNKSKNGPNSNRRIKYYFIDNEKKINKYKEEIIKLCETFNARAYISVNRKSYKKVAFCTLKKILNEIEFNRFESILKVIPHCAGVEDSNTERKYMIDLDSTDKDIVNKVLDVLKKENVQIDNILKSPHGFHIICYPFNTQKIKKELDNLNKNEEIATIKGKDALTVLYY